MSEAIIIALVGTGGAIFGGISTALATVHVGRQNKDIKSSDLLLEAQRQLTDTIADSQLLWQWNRQLIDHIWRSAPPPPPRPPEGLFHHED